MCKKVEQQIMGMTKLIQKEFTKLEYLPGNLVEEQGMYLKTGRSSVRKVTDEELELDPPELRKKVKLSDIVYESDVLFDVELVQMVRLFCYWDVPVQPDSLGLRNMSSGWIPQVVLCKNMILVIQ